MQRKKILKKNYFFFQHVFIRSPLCFHWYALLSLVVGWGWLVAVAVAIFNSKLCCACFNLKLRRLCGFWFIVLHRNIEWELLLLLRDSVGVSVCERLYSLALYGPKTQAIWGFYGHILPYNHTTMNNNYYIYMCRCMCVSIIVFVAIRLQMTICCLYYI